MLLQLCTWSEVETYLKSSKGIIIPIGSTEQHGPNGLIGTDAICPEVIARRVADEVGAMIGPTISVGMSQHHLGFAGSITLRPSTLIAVVKDYVQSLALHGFERFMFLNGHGGNIATTNAAFSEIYAETSLKAPGNGSGVRCVLTNWFDPPEVKKIAAELYGDRDGSHATASEVAVTQFAYPDHIKHADMEWTGPRGRGFTDAADYRRLHPDGRIGSDPSLSRPEHGQRLVEAAVPAIAAMYRKFVEQA